MTTYTFRPDPQFKTKPWDDPANWEGNVVPNSPDADVVLPDTSRVYIYNESFLVRSIQSSPTTSMQLAGSLTVTGDFNAQSTIDFNSGTLTVGSLEINSFIQGSGQIIGGSVTNNGQVLGISIQASAFQNNGLINTGTGSDLNIIVDQGNFANFSGTTLTGGSYEADYGYGGSHTLSLRGGGAIVTDSANLTLRGGIIRSFDPTTGTYVDIASSLRTVASSGSLTLANGDGVNSTYVFGPLAIEGTLALGGATLGSSPTIAVGGRLIGYGTVTAAVANDGLIETTSETTPRTLILNGPVTGTGSLEVAAGTPWTRFNQGTSSKLEIGASTSQTVIFENNIGTLLLDNPSTFSGKIAPAKQAGDQVVLPNINRNSITGMSYTGDSSGGVLTLQRDTGAISLNFIGNYTVDRFTLSSDSSGTLVTIGDAVCFASGTRIRTARGEVAVDDLAVGDLAVTASGEHRPIRWIGNRTLDPRRHPRPEEAMPVRIRAHALGDNKPARDLRVSPGHAIALDILGEVLIPAGQLVNGATIVQEAVESVTYWHVELDSHDLLIAENQPAESYLDMGNRGFFGQGTVIKLAAGPDGAPSFDPAARTHADFCRPYHADGLLVDAVRAQIRRRIEAQGWRLETLAPFADACLEVDGRIVRPEVHGLSAAFALPADVRDIWLDCPASVPRAADLGSDLRPLGLCLSGLRLEDGRGEGRTVALDDPLLCLGFYAAEPDHRWTAGRARLPAALFAGLDGEVVLRLDLAMPSMPRWIAPQAEVEAAAYDRKAA